jgi:tetratricopeptide (TPR) repeat protein
MVQQTHIAAGKLDNAISDTLPFVDQKTDYVWTSPQFAIGRAYFAKADYEKAVGFFEQSPADPASSLPLLAAAYAELGNQEKAGAALSRALKGNPQLTVAFMRFQFPNLMEML